MTSIRSLAGVSLQTKLLGVVGLIFLLVMVVTTWAGMVEGRAQLLAAARERVEELAGGYYDSLNVLMLTGQSKQGEVVREKVLGRPGIIGAKVLRAPELNRQYGTDGRNLPSDALEQAALRGEEVVSLSTANGGRRLTVILPTVATADSRGTNCLGCHPVASGTVLGAVRIDYSLADKDQAVALASLKEAGINLGILIVLYVMLRRIVIRRLAELRDTMHAIEAESDLARRIAAGPADELGQTSASFNRMLDKLQRLLGQMAETTEEITGHSRSMRDFSAQTRSRVERQQLESSQVAAAVNEMSASAQEVAQSAKSAADAAQAANLQAQEGRQVVAEAETSIGQLTEEVQKAAEVIHGLRKESTNIGKVLDVIRGIAEQTNLLALNAAIEAARAGEQGRGFAVVADEVRTLARRTGASTLEIRGLIESLQSRADEAVRVMEAGKTRAQVSMAQSVRAGAALDGISGGVATINDMNGLIAGAAAEQRRAAEEVDRSLGNIVQLARETADTAGQSEQLAIEVNSLLERLQGVVGQFKLGERAAR